MKTGAARTFQAPTTREIFGMSWPMALRAVMMFSIVIIDLYLVSSLGEEAVASIGIATVIIGTVMGTSLAFANAMQIKVAQAFGSEDTTGVKDCLLLRAFDQRHPCSGRNRTDASVWTVLAAGHGPFPTNR